jgi:hypothetical protein
MYFKDWVVNYVMKLEYKSCGVGVGVGVGWKLSSWRSAYKGRDAKLQVQVVEIEIASFKVRLRVSRWNYKFWDCNYKL